MARDETIAELRARVVDAALRRFADHGYAATSIQSIAADVGLSKQALMHHYRTKAVLIKVRDHLADHLPDLVLALTAAEDQVDHVVDRLVELFVDVPDISRFLLRERLQDTAFLPTDVGRAIFGLLVDYCRQGVRDGRLRADIDPEATVANLAVFFLATFSTLPDDRSDEVVDRRRRLLDAVRIVRSSLLPPELLAARQEVAW